jgi:hypothetical protein
MKLRVEAGNEVFEIELADTPTAKALLKATPFASVAQTWGQEVYFTTPITAKLEADAKQIVEPGTVCFWCEGDALALPFGPTPISSDERPKLASRCNILGRVSGDPSALAKVRAGDDVRVKKA